MDVLQSENFEIKVEKGPKRYTFQVNNAMRVREFITTIKDDIPGADDPSAYFIFRSKELEPNKLLTEYNITNGSILHICFRVHGGELSDLKQHPPNDVEEPDMFGMDDTPRIRMSCGHVIGPNSLTKFCFEKLDSGHNQIFCPYVYGNNTQCKAEWTFDEICKAALLDDKEKEKAEKMMNQVYLEPLPRCPNCEIHYKHLNKTDVIVCPFCTAQKRQTFKFCQYCTRPVTDFCKEDCLKPKQDILDNAEKKDIGGRMAPSIRECPTCSSLIKHHIHCKHITCPSCSKEFCFLCLRPWERNHLSVNCEIAPIQKLTKFIPTQWPPIDRTAMRPTAEDKLIWFFVWAIIVVAFAVLCAHMEQ